MNEIIHTLCIISLVYICPDTGCGSGHLIFQKCLALNLIIQIDNLYGQTYRSIFKFTFFVIHVCIEILAATLQADSRTRRNAP